MKYKFNTMEYATKNKKLSYYISEEHPLYEDLLSLIRTEYKSETHLYEARANTEYVVNDLTGKLIKTGRINLVGYELQREEDIIELARIIGNKKFETSRLLYVKDGKIVGQDAVTVDLPALALTHPEKNDDIAFAKIQQKAERVGADGYYMVHNHPSGDSHVSGEDIMMCQRYAKNLPGFLGGIVIGDNNFSMIRIDEKDLSPSIEFQGEILDDRALLNDPQGIISYLKQLNYNDTNSSLVIYVDTKGKLISIQSIANKEFNDKNIFAYINNEKHRNGAIRSFLCTFSKDIYWMTCKYAGRDNLFEDVFLASGSSYQSARAEHHNLNVMFVNDTAYKPYKL